MSTHNHTRLASVRARVRRIWSGLDHANRRMFDIRSGAHFMKRQETLRGCATRRRGAAH
jgi:hypothetical protein